MGDVNFGDIGQVGAIVTGHAASVFLNTSQATVQDDSATRIFISYRRADSAGYAERLKDWLGRHLGLENIFVDVESIRGGELLEKKIVSFLRKADLCLALIGPDWLDETSGEPTPWVEKELQLASSNMIPILPVLVNNADIQILDGPTKDRLSSRLAVRLDANSWSKSCENLLDAIRAALGRGD